MNAYEINIQSQIIDPLDNCRAYKKQLIQEITELEDELEIIKKPRKHTAKILKDINRVESKIKSNELHIAKIEAMIGFPLDSWVIKDKKPGKVADLTIFGRMPEIQILWEGSTVSVPENPLNIKKLNPELLEYVWYGRENRYKLIRKLDQAECTDYEILQKEEKKYSNLLEISLNSGAGENVNQQYKSQLVYLSKRIKKINSNDLEVLERAVRQGLLTFKKTSNALADIRDRKLYRDLGFKNFEAYCRERWGISRTQGYRFIEAAKVMKNLKAVSNEKNLELPEIKKEYQARVLATIPQDKQAEVWQEATKINDNPTAKQIKKAALAAFKPDLLPSDTIEDPNFPANPPYKQFKISDQDLQVNKFKVGQIASINSNRSDKRLIGHQGALCLITAVNDFSVNVKLWKKSIESVSPNDLKIVRDGDYPVLSSSIKIEKMGTLLSLFDDVEQIFDTAIAARKNEFFNYSKSRTNTL